MLRNADLCTHMHTFYIANLHGKYYELSGAAKPYLDILLLHPFPLSWQYYEHTIAALLPSLQVLAQERGRIRVIIPDLPGFGGSQLPNSEPHNLQIFVDAVEAIVVHFACNNLLLGGCSMGGYVSLEYIRTHEVQGLILLDTRFGADTDEGRANRLSSAQQFFSSQQGDSPLGGIQNEFVSNFMDSMLSKLFSPHTFATSPTLVAEIRNIMAQQHPRAVAYALLAMAGRTSTESVLAKFFHPVLIVVGEDDQLTNVTQSEQMHAVAAKSELYIIPKVGHLASVEAAEQFSNIFVKWLQSTF